MATDMQVFMQFMRHTLLPLPGVTEKMCFDDPAFYVNKKIFTNVKLKDELLAVHTLERDEWMAADPVTFFVTEHYLNYKYMLVRLETVSPDDLKNLLITAWHNRATKRLISEYEALKLPRKI
jgi:hypothetical protein